MKKLEEKIQRANLELDERENNIYCQFLCVLNNLAPRVGEGEKEMKKSYCTQNDGKCGTCSLVNYNLDCANNPIPQPHPTDSKVRELIESERWAVKKLQRIEKYEKEGIMPEQCSKRLAFELIRDSAKKILSNPSDPEREIWEESFRLAHKQI